MEITRGLPDKDLSQYWDWGNTLGFNQPLDILDPEQFSKLYIIYRLAKLEEIKLQVAQHEVNKNAFSVYGESGMFAYLGLMTNDLVSRLDDEMRYLPEELDEIIDNQFTQITEKYKKFKRR